jgi:NAD(P)H-hydrate repair Nnr-like enzyme with NAD(P)H-hydrate epimerase domain
MLHCGNGNAGGDGLGLSQQGASGAAMLCIIALAMAA